MSDTKINYTKLGEKLRNIIRDNGNDILNDAVLLSEKLKEHGCDEIAQSQLLLMLKASNIKNYIPQQKTGISMVDVNNIITCAVAETGLSRITVKNLTTALLYGLSMPTDIESVVLPDENYRLSDVAFADFEEYEEYLENALCALDELDEEAFAEYSEKIEYLVKAGHPKALYIKGYCHFKGFGAVKDDALAIKYLKASSACGFAKAGALLGDIYYNGAQKKGKYPYYTKAFEQYTAIGAITLDEERQKRVTAVLHQTATNVRTLIFAGIYLFGIIAFNILLGSGAFSFDGDSHWTLAVFSILFNSAVFGLGVFSSIKFKYDTVKPIIPVMTVITMLFALWAV